MLFMNFRKWFIFLLIRFSYNIVKGAESNEEMPSYEYLQIFKSIPTLFEYLLDTLESSPEILEKNDIAIFSRSADAEKEEARMKRDMIDTNQAKYLKSLDELKLNSHNKDTKEVNYTTGLTTAGYEYGNSIVVIKEFTKSNRDKTVKKDIKLSLQDEEVKDTIGNNDSDAPGEIPSKQKELFDDSGIKNTYIGMKRHLAHLGLDPDEVVTQILTIEELLEKHNNEKKN